MFKFGVPASQRKIERCQKGCLFNFAQLRDKPWVPPRVQGLGGNESAAPVRGWMALTGRPTGRPTRPRQPRRPCVRRSGPAFGRPNGPRPMAPGGPSFASTYHQQSSFEAMGVEAAARFSSSSIRARRAMFRCRSTASDSHVAAMFMSIALSSGERARLAIHRHSAAWAW
jgi:hypothetical protein